MSKRPLTAGETALVKRVFGDSVNCKTVTVHSAPFIPLQGKGVAMAPNGNLYMHDCFSEDYTQEPPRTQSLFIHEMTHVWQHQNKILNPILSFVGLTLRQKFNYAAAYDYTLDSKKDLLDYNMEQQASIVQDYFLLDITQQKMATNHCCNTGSMAEKIALYKKVLASFLKDPGYAQRKSIFHRRKKPKSSPPGA